MDVQIISLDGSSEGSSHVLTSPSVKVATGPPMQVERDSARVQSNVLSQFKWETKLYEGRIVAVERARNLVAYCLDLGSSVAVRVTHRITKARLTIKGFSGGITDLAWALRTAQPMLGCVDDAGNLYVHSITEDGGDTLIHTNHITVRRADAVPKGLRLLGLGGGSSDGKPYRIVWCPYVPDADSADKPSEDGLSTMVAVYKGNRCEVLMLDQIIDALPDKTKRETSFDHIASKVKHAYACIEEKTDIRTACVSPDSTALALGTEGGLVKFYILEVMEEVRMAHEWPPHGNDNGGRPKPVDTLVFLDNLHEARGMTHETFWKYALTTTGGNRELKLWNCEDWSSLGCVELAAAPGKAEGWGLSLTLDPTAHILLLSDIERRALYALEIAPMSGGGLKFARIIDFPLTAPILDWDFISYNKPSPSRRDASPSILGMESTEALVEVEIAAVTPRTLAEMKISYPAEEQPTSRRVSVSTDSGESQKRGRRSAGGRSAASSRHSSKSKASPVPRLESTPPPPPPKASSSASVSPPVRLSPEDAEIQHILESGTHPPKEEVGVDDREEEEEDEESKLSVAGIPSRPKSPLVHSLVSRDDSVPPHKDSRVKRSAGKQRGPKPAKQRPDPLPQPSIAVEETWEDEEPAVSEKRMEVVATVPPELIDSISKTGMELERVVAHLARQEEELKALKEASKESGRNMNRIGEKMRDNMNSGFRAVEGGIRGKTSEDLKAMETRLKADMRAVIHSQMGDDAKRLELSINDRLGAGVERAVAAELGKSLKNKATVVAIGRVIAEAVASEVAAGCKSEFTMSIVPTFKHSTTNLFTQLNQVFQKGIKDYIEQLEKQAGGVVGSSEESRRQLEQRLEEMGRETREMSQLHLQQMSTSLQNQVEQSMEAVAKQISAKTTEALKSTMKEELSGLSAQLSNASLRSNAATPAAPTGPEAEKIALQRKLALQVQQKDLNGAFQTALNACDLEILTFLLSKLEPKALFAKSPFPLSTPVLLSLLHQLAAADLRKDTELKLKYLDEALSALDESAPDVQKYLPKITADLTTRIKEFKESKPAMSNPLGRLLRKIEASCQSF